jgi:hypothetical protein
MHDAPFLIDKNYTFFTPLDILSTLLGIVVLLIILYLRRRRNHQLDYYKYYIPAFSFKVLFVMANAIFYIVSYGAGGDSIGFWDGAVKLNHLFWENPFGYFEEIYRSDEGRTLYKNFNLATGYPDGHIYDESESFFISKIASFFTFFTFKGYILMSIVFAFITTNASWRLFELARSFKLHKDWHLALAIFFIPSLSFWCGGISKDTVVFVAICYFLHNLFIILSKEKKRKLKNWIYLLVCVFVIMQVRSFILVTLLVPLLFAYSAQLAKKFEKRNFEKFTLRLFITTIGVSTIVIFFQTTVADEFLNEAAVINKDMTTNKTYGTKRYELGITDYSPIGMVTAFPTAVIAGFYRPFIWEALSFSLILNGVESVVLLFFTFRFLVNSHILERIKRIRKHEFLVFAFFFALILAYFAGFTSILFGVLVRFKAPVLPFLVILLTAHYIEEKQVKKELELEDRG